MNTLTETPKLYMKTRIMNKFSNMTGCMIYFTNWYFFYNQQQSYREGDCGHAPIYNILKETKYLGINLTKEVKALTLPNLP